MLDIHTGRPTGKVSIPFPYNLYFTPDGTKAVDVVERLNRVEFRDWRNGWKLMGAVYIPWRGADHLDFSADGSYLLISTEYSGMVAKVDTVSMKLVGFVHVGGLPIDVRLSPDGSVFYVTNQGRMGVSVVDPVSMKEVQFISTGRGAHGLQVSRDTNSLYVSNRLEGSVSVTDFDSRSAVASSPPRRASPTCFDNALTRARTSSRCRARSRWRTSRAAARSRSVVSTPRRATAALRASRSVRRQRCQYLPSPGCRTGPTISP